MALTQITKPEQLKYNHYYFLNDGCEAFKVWFTYVLITSLTSDTQQKIMEFESLNSQLMSIYGHSRSELIAKCHDKDFKIYEVKQ